VVESRRGEFVKKGRVAAGQVMGVGIEESRKEKGVKEVLERD